MTVPNRKSVKCVIALVIMLAHLPALRAASTLRGFPVRLGGSAEVGGALPFDIDGDGRLELVLPAGNGLHALEVDGNSLQGFPLKTDKGSGIVTPLTIGYLAGDQTRAVILFGSEDQKLMAYDGTGQLLEGFPVVLDGVMAGAPVLGDVNGDNAAEIIFGTSSGKIYAVDSSGKTLPGYPAKAGAPVSTAVTVGHFRPGEAALLIFGDQKGNLHAWRAPGEELKGFPYKALYTVASQPVLGDIDDDGSFEVVFGSKDFKIYAVKETGKVAAGFPVGTGYRIYSSCALADIDGDGITDVVATSGDGSVYAVSKGGKKLKGFPVKVGRRLRASPVIGDVDCDGRLEIAVGTDGGRLALLRNNGEMYPGFPARMADRIDVAPLLADINGDGLVEICAVSRDGTLSVFKVIKKGKVPPVLAWPAEGRNPDRRGITWPNPPRYLDLALAPEAPRTSDELSLSYRFFDLDGDAEPQTRIRWYRNFKPVAELDGARKVPSAATRKHQRWHYTLRAGEHGRIFKSPEVRVGNTPPGPARVAVLPDPPRTSDDLAMKIVTESPDADGDKIQYGITWLKDRVPVKGLRRPKVSAKATASGQRWTVVVVPGDGETNGAPARASIQVANTPPSAPKVRLEPARPAATQDVRAVVERPGKDPDGEKVTYRYRWEVAGRVLNLPADTAVLPAGFARKRDKVAVDVTSFDGKETGGSTRTESRAVNSPAGAPRVRIYPDRPKTGDDLSVEIVKPAVDPDGDVLKYEFLWRREPEPYAGPHARSPHLPAKETKKGERWSVGVTPTDGDDQGKLSTAEVTISNSPPSAPEISAKNPRPTTAEDLVLRVVKSPVDPDGDEVSVEVVWSQGKKPVARGTGLWRLEAAKTRKGLKYHAAVTPSDGLLKGPTVDQWFEVRNTPPSKCAVTLPYKPHTHDDLTVRLAEKPADPDGDPVKMRFQWYKNGEPVKSGPKPQQMEGKRVARGQRWTVVATPSDGEDAGPPCEASTLVGNSPPSPAGIALKPQKPTAGESLVAEITGKPTDIDKDEVSLGYLWTVDGKPFPAGDTTAAIPAGVVKKGQKWKVTVVASDGELQSKPATAEVTVINSPPPAPRVAIRPAEPLSSDDLLCRLAGPTLDVDGDPLKHTFDWFRVKGKKAEPAGKARAKGFKLPAKLTKKGQYWVCRVRAHDGKVHGEFAEARVQVANAAPASPEVEIQPADPASDTKLECVIKAPAKDPDGDKVRYRFVWTKDGVAQSFAPVTDRVPGRLTREKDIWQCTVTATDGRLSSPPAYSQEVIVRPK